MKKIYSFALAAVALVSAASCQEELANFEPQTEGGDFTVTAIASAESKTVLVEGVKTYWTPGDKISVFNAEGNSVEFSTDITTNAASAQFTNTAEFVAPENLYAAYPDRGGVQKLVDGVINNFRIAGSQTAVAGSFDPTFGSAVGIEGTDGNLEFKSIHALIKFTIGGENAPSVVTFTNGGARNIAGLFTYNTATGKIGQGDGAKAITLTPAAGKSFEVGQTYYIAVISGGNFADMTLDFDGTVVKTVAGAKYADETNGYLLGKIINLGTVEFPTETEKPEEPEGPVVSDFASRVWGKFSIDGTSWWLGGPESLEDRNMTMDDEFVYVANSTENPAIHKFNITDGAYAGSVDVTGMATGTHPVSVVKMVKNTDAAVNGGKDILVACNLTTDGAALQIWAWENGVDAAPVQKYSLAAARRFGDKMNFSGTWQSGKFWFRSNQANDALVANIPVNNGAVQTWIDAYRMTCEDYQCMSDVFWYPQANSTVADYCLIGTNSSTALYLMSGTSAAGAGTVNTKYEKLKNTLGVNFFEYNGVKYVAWVSMANGGNKPRLQIVELDGSSLASLKTGLDAYPHNVVFEAPIQSESDFAAAGANGGVNADCAVRVINGEVYIAAMGWKNGLSVFKLK